MFKSKAPKHSTKKIAKHTKKVAKQPKKVQHVAQRTISMKPTATTAPAVLMSAKKQQQSIFAPQQTTFNTQFRAFHQTKRLFDAPAPTAPAEIDNIAPEVQNIVDNIMKLNIMQTLQLVKVLKKEFGYSDAAFAMPVAAVAAAPGAGAGAAEEEKPAVVAKTAFNVKLESFDAASKVKVIKEVRTITGLGLKEAKELVDGAPQILKKEVKKEEAEAIIKTLQEVGAVCVME